MNNWTCDHCQNYKNDTVPQRQISKNCINNQTALTPIFLTVAKKQCSWCNSTIRSGAKKEGEWENKYYTKAWNVTIFVTTRTFLVNIWWLTLKSDNVKDVYAHLSMLVKGVSIAFFMSKSKFLSRTCFLSTNDPLI